ncbi:MAG: outer membrane protein transport protein [Ferrimonas sp.]
MNKLTKIASGCMLALVAGQSAAAGFQLNSQSATGIGRAFAGDAVIADNASVLSRNPAAMAMFNAPAFSGGLTFADIQVDVKNASVNDAELGSISDAADAKVIPNLYYIHPLSDNFAVGSALFSNYGTGTNTNSLITAANAPLDLLGETEVTTINWNLSASYRINEQLSVGAGIDIIYGEGYLQRGQGAIVDVDASGIGLGAILGATYEFNANHRIGLSYRFSPSIQADGTIDVFNTTVGTTVSFDEIEVPVADIFQVAGFHQLTPVWAMHYTLQWTQWSTFDSIELTDGYIGNTSVGNGTLKEYHWKDSWFTSLGTTYNVNDLFSVRAGIAYDQGVTDELTSVSIPDSDRIWYSVGATMKLSNQSSLDFGFAHVSAKAADVEEKSELLSLLAPNDIFLTATTKSSANYFSVQFNHQF